MGFEPRLISAHFFARWSGWRLPPTVSLWLRYRNEKRTVGMTVLFVVDCYTNLFPQLLRESTIQLLLQQKEQIFLEALFFRVQEVMIFCVSVYQAYNPNGYNYEHNQYFHDNFICILFCIVCTTILNHSISY